MNSNDLYRQVILDHNRNPRNYGELVDATHSCEGYNALCGDRLKVYLQIEGDVIMQVRFVGEGCAISRASASLMGEAIKGKTIAEAKTLFEQFRAMVRGDLSAEDQKKVPARLRSFASISAYPARVKCAVLAWHAVFSAVEKQAKAETETSY